MGAFQIGFVLGLVLGNSRRENWLAREDYTPLISKRCVFGNDASVRISGEALLSQSLDPLGRSLLEGGIKPLAKPGNGRGGGCLPPVARTVDSWSASNIRCFREALTGNEQALHDKLCSAL